MKRLFAVLLAILTVFASAVYAESAAPAEEVQPEPTPWAGDGHWYTFQLLETGVMVSGIRDKKYDAVEMPFFTTGEGVAIGKMKGMITTIKVYTADPEERVIWFIDDPYRYSLVLAGTEIPDYDAETGMLELRNNDTFEGTPMSAEAREEFLALRKQLETAGEPAEGRELPYRFMINIMYPELPALRLWLKETITEMDGRPVLVSWVRDETGDISKWLPVRAVDVDPEGALMKECAALSAPAEDGEAAE